jgi:hypothetical protein
MLEARRGLRAPSAQQQKLSAAGRQGKEAARRALGGLGWETVSTPR